LLRSHETATALYPSSQAHVLIQTPVCTALIFAPTSAFFRVRKTELRESERVIAKATASGWARQIEMNERKRNNLVNIITSLERTHA
jgi:hypothetical protein